MYRCKLSKFRYQKCDVSERVTMRSACVMYNTLDNLYTKATIVFPDWVRLLCRWFADQNAYGPTFPYTTIKEERLRTDADICLEEQ